MAARLEPSIGILVPDLTKCFKISLLGFALLVEECHSDPCWDFLFQG